MNPDQKMNWDIVVRFTSFNEANAAREALKAEGKAVKIHLMGGDDVPYFAVKVGTPVVRKDTDELPPATSDEPTPSPTKKHRKHRRGS